MKEKQVHQKNFLSTAEVADMLGISPATLRKWRATDTGPRFYKFNRSVFYKREDIERGFPSITCWLSRRTEGRRVYG